jgi:hypothetical protein
METNMVLTKSVLFIGTKVILLTLLLTSLNACNEAEFYQKKFLKGLGVDVDGNIPDGNDIPLDSPEHPNNQLPEDLTHHHEPGKPHQPNCPNQEDDHYDPTAQQESEDPRFLTMTEVFTQSEQAQSKVDIIWVVDDSGSMGDEQNSLAYNFDAFIQDFMSKEINFRMAITTTDPTKKRDGKMVCDWHVLNSLYAAINRQNFVAMFEKCIKVGTKGSGHEKGLNAIDRFLYHYNDGNKSNRNDSFLREDAYLVVVIVSDEEDQSSRNVSHYIERLRSVKVNAGKVKVFSIVNTKANTEKYESKGVRYMTASKATNGVVADIDDSFYQILKDFGYDIINLLNRFTIAHKIANNSIIVEVNGIATTEFTFDQITNSIKFNSGFTPAASSEIRVTYSVLE